MRSNLKSLQKSTSSRCSASLSPGARAGVVWCWWGVGGRGRGAMAWQGPAAAWRPQRTRRAQPATQTVHPPGKPQIKVVRRARPGMRSRSVRSSLRVWAWGGRFMARRVRLEMCCSGMSMYLQTCRRAGRGRAGVSKGLQAAEVEWACRLGASCPPSKRRRHTPPQHHKNTTTAAAASGRLALGLVAISSISSSVK